MVRMSIIRGGFMVVGARTIRGGGVSAIWSIIPVHSWWLPGSTGRTGINLGQREGTRSRTRRNRFKSLLSYRQHRRSRGHLDTFSLSTFRLSHRCAFR